MNSNPSIVVVEDDPWTRLIGVALDPATSNERRAAFADYMSPDEPDFAGWCDQIRARAGGLYSSAVRFVSSPIELRADLPFASALVVESLAVDRPAKASPARPSSGCFANAACRFPSAPTMASPFASPNALFNLSKLSVWWLRFGIAIERIKPGRPQQEGRRAQIAARL